MLLTTIRDPIGKVGIEMKNKVVGKDVLSSFKKKDYNVGNVIKID
jgi:hypothetical protein